MSRFMQTAALVGAFAATAYGHGRVTSISAEGKEYPGFMNEYLYGVEIPADLTAWSANNGDNGFVAPTQYGSAADIACHLDGKPGGGAATVKAGSKVSIQWGPDVWPESHHGPVLDYLAKCAGDDCSSVSAADLSFFKIDEAGLNDGSTAPGQWASDDLIAAGGKWEVTIPASLAPGQYVLRHEIIALHSAGDANGAQNYPQCFNLEVTGSGSASPTGVTADMLYTATDAGIQVGIYMAPVTYEIPGPAVWDGASSGGSGPAPGKPSGKPTKSASEAGPKPTSAPESAPTYGAPVPSAPASSPAPSAPASESYAAPSSSSTPVAAPSTPAASPSSAAPPYGGSNSTILPSGTGTGTGSFPTATGGAPYPSATYAAPSSSSAAPSYSSDVPVGAVTETPSPSEYAPAPTSSSSSAAAPVPTGSYGSDDDEEDESAPEAPSYGSGSGSSQGGAMKPIPEGVTLQDLLAWLNYYVKKGYQADSKRVHARDILRRL